MSRGCRPSPGPRPEDHRGPPAAPPAATPPAATPPVATPTPGTPLTDPAPAAPAAPASGPRFRYIGSTVLHVVGPRSGRRYHFEGYGNELDVDSRDAPFLTAVPRLVRSRP